MTNFSASWNDPNGGVHTTNLTLRDDVPGFPVYPALPIVILLHGMGGDINHMANPSVSPGLNFDLGSPLPAATIDRGWHIYPNRGFWSISLDPTYQAVGWEGRLIMQGYATLNYAQVDPWGLLARAVLELGAVVRATIARFGKRVVFVCHSRGGLLLRLFLQHNRGDTNLLSKIAGAVMLHVPNQGSQVADIAAGVHTAIGVLRPLAWLCAPFQVALNWLDGFVTHPAIAELSPSSQLLVNLRDQEAVPLPVAIPIHTFGGTDPHLVTLRFSVFDPISEVPLWHWPPFHWFTHQFSLRLLDGTVLTNVSPEEGAGGDILVTDSRSHLPGEASHHANPVNHPAALWDNTLAAQVLPVLRGLH
jgi:hypothetical protein